MMSVERSFEAWEEVQRHGQDLADRFTQSFTGLIQSTHHHITPPSFTWPPHSQLLQTPKVEFPNHTFITKDLGLAIDGSGILDIGTKIGQASADLGAGLNGMVEQLFRRLPVPMFKHEDDNNNNNTRCLSIGGLGEGRVVKEGLEELAERFKDYEEEDEDESFGGNAKALKHLGRSQGTFNVTSTYDSRTRNVESSVLARGDLWRVEASQGSSRPGNENSSLFLVQLGPLLFVRDSTLLLPVHLSKQHLLWYGYDRKNGMHSLCPAIWSKHRRWLLMSMICLNPLACSFMDVQFPNGQLTYVSGEGLSTSAFLPFCGGLLQAQGQYPGEMKFSFSCKNKWGTRITPTVQWPDKSFALGLEQALAWKRSGLLVRPTVQFSVCPTFGGSCPGMRMELTHSVRDELNLICGCSLVAHHPSAFASLSVGRSKWNGNVGSTGVVVKAETPLGHIGRPSFSVQLNSGIEF